MNQDDKDYRLLLIEKLTLLQKLKLISSKSVFIRVPASINSESKRLLKNSFDYYVNNFKCYDCSLDSWDLFSHNSDRSEFTMSKFISFSVTVCIVKKLSLIKEFARTHEDFSRVNIHCCYFPTKKEWRSIYELNKNWIGQLLISFEKNQEERIAQKRQFDEIAEKYDL